MASPPKKRGAAIRDAAGRLADLIGEHLSEMSPSERKKRLDAFHRTVSKDHSR